MKEIINKLKETIIKDFNGHKNSKIYKFLPLVYKLLSVLYIIPIILVILDIGRHGILSGILAIIVSIILGLFFYKVSKWMEEGLYGEKHL